MLASSPREGFTVRPDPGVDDAENTPPSGDAGGADSRDGLGAMSVLNERNTELEQEVAKYKEEGKNLIHKKLWALFPASAIIDEFWFPPIGYSASVVREASNSLFCPLWEKFHTGFLKTVPEIFFRHPFESPL